MSDTDGIHNAGNGSGIGNCDSGCNGGADSHVMAMVMAMTLVTVRDMSCGSNGSGNNRVIMTMITL